MNKPDSQYFASISTIVITIIIMLLAHLFTPPSYSSLCPKRLISQTPPPRPPSCWFPDWFGQREAQAGDQSLGYLFPTPSLICLICSRGCLPSSTTSVKWPLLQESCPLWAPSSDFLSLLLQDMSDKSPIASSLWVP